MLFETLACRVGIATTIALSAFSSSAIAQDLPLLPDNTLGSESTQLVPQAGSNVLVEGGAQREAILFHSFEQFNVSSGQQVYFENPKAVGTILMRVTGGSQTNILGTLGVNGGADLFVINPLGISFGPEAQLDITGSFLATTADSVAFDNAVFSALAPQPVPLLTVSRPIGLNFEGSSSPITYSQSRFTGSSLVGVQGETFALVGGDIVLDSAVVFSDSGRLELGTVQRGSVDLSFDDGGFMLNYETVEALGDLTLTNQSLIQINSNTANPYGYLRIISDDTVLDGDSLLVVRNLSDQAGPDLELAGRNLNVLNGSGIISTAQAGGDGGVIRIATEDTTRFSGVGIYPSRAESFVLTPEAVQGGAIEIETGQLRLEEGGAIFNLTDFFSQGTGADIVISARESVILESETSTDIRSNIGNETRGSGRGGNIYITTPLLQMDEAYRIQTSSWLDGDSGDIVIDAENISVAGTNPFAQILGGGINNVIFGSGNGGDITLLTQNLSVTESSNIATIVFGNRDELAGIIGLLFDTNYFALVGLPGAGEGDAGDINISADTIRVAGVDVRPDSPASNIASNTLGSGDAGDVNIQTRSLTVEEGGIVGSSTLFSFSLLGQPVIGSGRGDGGDVNIMADTILVDGVGRFGLPSGIATQTFSTGNAGNTTILTRELAIRNGGVVSAGTATPGDAGQLVVEADRVSVDGVHASGQPSVLGTFAAAPDDAIRNAFFLPELPEGDTGQLRLSANNVDITNGGTVSVAHDGTGNAGELQVNAEQLRLLNGGSLSATTRSGEGGDVVLIIEDVLLLRGSSRITAAAQGGQGAGGNLLIDAGVVLGLDNSDLIANSFGGPGGQVEIATNALLGLTPRDRLTAESDITASSGVGLDGTVQIETPLQDPEDGTEELPVELADPSNQITAGCVADDGARFVTSGRGGVPADPTMTLPGAVVLEDWRDGPSQPLTLTGTPLATPPTPLQEAQNWRRNAQGEVELVAEAVVGNAAVVCQ